MSNEKHEHNDDSLERLFQKKAGEYDIPYKEEDWLSLKNQLDLYDAKRVYKRRFLWLAAASLLIVSVLGYFTYDHHTRINELSGQLTEALTEQAQQNPAQQDQESERPENSIPERPQPDSESNSRDESTAATSEEFAADTSTPASTGAETEYPDHIDELIVQEITEVESEQVSCTECAIDRFASRIAPYNPVAATPVEDIYSQSVRGVQAPAQTENDQDIRTSRSGFTAGLAISPDFSSGGSLSNFSSTGYKIGITVSYRLSDRFSVSTGILQSDVRYAAQGKDYNPPSGYWNYGISADEVLAQCLLLDIPVRLEYKVKQWERSGIFVSGGVSSYIMLNEQYRFSYDRDDTGLAQEWNDKTGTGHWLSNAGFSAGFEFEVIPNWNLRIEPFLQIPISGVGWGEVNLYSAGTMVAFSYRFKK
jgi:hypothetical protein